MFEHIRKRLKMTNADCFPEYLSTICGKHIDVSKLRKGLKPLPNDLCIL